MHKLVTTIMEQDKLDSIMLMLHKITESQKELIRDNELLKEKLQNNANVVHDLHVIEYYQDYITMLQVYSESFDPCQVILDSVSQPQMDSNISSLVRLFGMIYLPDNRKKDWNIQLLDKKQHKFSYLTTCGESITDYNGNNIFKMFMSNYEQALCRVINNEIDKTLNEIEEGKDTDSAYGLLLNKHINKCYASLIKIKNSSENFIKKLIHTYF
jgi:hypothetical protein